MSTNKLRVQGYLHSDLYYQFDGERKTLGLTQSQALEKILQERYFTGTENITDVEASISVTLRLLNLEDRLTRLEEDSSLLGNANYELNRFINDLPSELPSESESESESELISELPSELLSELPLVTGKLFKNREPLREKWLRELEAKYAWEDGHCRLRLNNGEMFVGLICSVSNREKTCKIFNPLTDTQLNVKIDRLVLPPSSDIDVIEGKLLSNLPSELDKEGISQLSLAQRLGCSDRYLRKLEKQGKLLEWSKEKDPQQISWELRGRKYYPRSVELQESAT